MKSIVDENLVSFKMLEQKIYDYVCELGRLITQQVLESYDAKLTESRDKKTYRGKGKRKTSIKTVYGEVEYRRTVYRTKTKQGETAYVYLLDEAMQMDKIGLISTNLAEKIAMTVTEAPYRVTAETISNTCGQTISSSGVWNMMQRLGERIAEEEQYAVKEMHAERAQGEKVIPVLFEEMDGIWLHMQNSNHRKMKKQEMKVFTMYEGWDKEQKKRSSLVEKTMLAGMESSQIFHEKREALIEKKYNADEIQQRILNGDGGSWIRETYDPDAIFQLDRYHIYQEILRKISDCDAQRKGILYKNMGVQESQNCTVITMRMKHRRMRWSAKGANNLAKVLCCKENKELCSTIERYTDGLIFHARMNEVIETLSAAKAPKKDGKGNPYVDVIRGHVSLLDAATSASRKVFRDAFIR